MVVAVGLSLLQVAFLEELLDEEEKHARVAREEVLDLVQGHVLGVARRLERTLDEVVRAGDGDQILQFGEVVWVQLVVFDQLSGRFSVLGPRESSDQALFEIGYDLNEHLRLLHFVDVDEVNAELENVKLVVKAELHDASGRIDVPRGVEILLGQVQEVVRADLKLEVLDVVVDNFGTNGPELVHRILLVLCLNLYRAVLNHETKMV